MCFWFGPIEFQAHSFINTFSGIVKSILRIIISIILKIKISCENTKPYHMCLGKKIFYYEFFETKTKIKISLYSQ